MWKDIRSRILKAKKKEIGITNKLLKRGISMQSRRDYWKRNSGLGVVKCKKTYLYRKKEAFKIKKWKEW
jgi:hypothetical protein